MSLKCILQGQDLSKESLEAHIADKNNPHDVTPQQIGAATLADIPTSLPASDVYSWAKQPNKPSYTYSEVGAAASNHNHNNLYYTQAQVNSLLAKKADINSPSPGEIGSSVVNGRLYPGEIVKFDGLEWMVVHCNYSSNVAYLLSKYVLFFLTFGPFSGNRSYAKSNLAAETAKYQNTMSSQALSRAINTTVNGVTSKLFIPSVDRYQTDSSNCFSYFKTSGRLAATDRNGDSASYWASDYWDSDSHGDVQDKGAEISNTGAIIWYNSTGSSGFRPCIAITM